MPAAKDKRNQRKAAKPAEAKPPVPPEPPPVEPPAPTPEPTPFQRVPWWQSLLGALAIVLAGLLAYANSFHGDFVLDDLPGIKENQSIQNGWSQPPPPVTEPQEILERLYERLPTPLQPPNDGQTVTGRPLVNASFQMNFAISAAQTNDGFHPEVYHITSLTIHLLAGLALFGLVRRTLELPKVRSRIKPGAALPVALAAALLWTVHPLQTESVTYMSQRAESMMGLFYLLTLYCYARSKQGWRWLWLPLAALACLASTLSKEVTITLPLMVIIYDYIFIAESPAEPWLRRWPAYIGFAGAMAVQLWLKHHAGDRGRSAGFGIGVDLLDYALAQGPQVLNYLKLALWPHPLVLDYGDSLALHDTVYTFGTFAAVFAVLVLSVGTLILIIRRPMLGFLGAWFFIILAPSSSVLPIITEVAAEHRMYLPLAALAVLAALGLWKLLGRWTLLAAPLLALPLMALTFARNDVYRSGLEMWRDTVTQHPDIARAHENYAIALDGMGRARESVAEYQAAERLKSNYPDCDNNLANALAELGRNEEAVTYYARAVNNLLRPHDQAIAAYNMGNALRALGRYDDALKAYSFAANLSNNAAAYHNIATVYFQMKNYDQAITFYERALVAQPVFPQCELNLANVYSITNHPDQAEQHYLRAVAEDPNNADAHAHFGLLYTNQGRYQDAISQLAIAAQLQPKAAQLHYLLGYCYARLNRPGDAAREFTTALQLQPDYPEAKAGLDAARAAGG